MAKRALILGINGMDGSILAGILLRKGYEVHGTVRRSSVDNLWRLAPFEGRVVLHRADLSDPGSVEAALGTSQPHEVYNEADQDNVGWSRSMPSYSVDVTCGAVQRTLESIRKLFGSACKFFQPLSSTMFGEPTSGRQDEMTKMAPRSPYAVAKVGARYWCDFYREVYKMPVVSGILYTHTSETQRGEYLVHKIAKYAAGLRLGKMPSLRLGNLDQRVDVGWAPQFMQAVSEIMASEWAGTWVIGTGNGVSVKDVVDAALHEAGIRNRAEDVWEKDPDFYQDIPPHLVADTYRLVDRFGGEIRPDIGADVVVRRLVRHYMEQR